MCMCRRVCYRALQNHHTHLNMSRNLTISCFIYNSAAPAIFESHATSTIKIGALDGRKRPASTVATDSRGI